MNVKRGNSAYRDIMTYIEFELAQQITQEKAIVPAATGRVSRQLKNFPLNTEVEIVPDNKNMHVLSLIAGDRPGLLARIALIFDKYNIQLHRAKINTLGSRAEDVFWISGSALAESEQQDALRNALLQI
jgi:[protein-PII] uridylyltransferase